jgi:hypothetical protein
MGMFSKLRGMTGTPSGDLLENGVLGRGIITDVRQTSVSTGSEWNPSHVCVFNVEVSLDDTPRYMAECRQAVPATILPQLASGNATVAVRVNPTDGNEIALSLGEEPPTVTASSGDANTGSAAEILANGESCRAVIVQSQPLGKRNAQGVDLYALLLTVMADGRAPFQVPVGNPVPPEAVPLLYPGNNVPAKYMPERGDNHIVVDWAAAVEQATPAG